ncbi:MAG: AIR carboxylase family protein [Rhodocyclaceae bacterium]|nr:AIR carboxylase family protein [Rhodocyclaceae bacterium]
MQAAASVLDEIGVSYEARVVSAHRTPALLFDYASDARKRGPQSHHRRRGWRRPPAGHAGCDYPVPVLGVPIPSKYLKGMDSLLSIVQMPKGSPVATFAIGEAGAANAALFAVAMLAADGDGDGRLADKLLGFRQSQADKVMAMRLQKPQ